MYLLYIATFILGICAGSFINVLVDRLPRGEDIFITRSRCESCNKTLKWFDLIPVLSCLLLKGKCRHCGKTIPRRLIWLEIITGVTFLLIAIYFFHSTLSAPWFIYSLILITFLTAIFFADLFFGIIPDLTLVVIAFTALIYQLFFSRNLLLGNLLSGTILFALFFLLYFLTKGKGMGFGDVKFSFLIGFVLGPGRAAVALYLAFLTASIVSIILILLKKKKFHGGIIAFGPFLVLGFLAAYFWGDKIINVIKIFL